MPHHESLQPTGNLAIPPPPAAPSSPRPEHRRISAIVEQEESESKRNSQISATSTTSGTKGRRKTHIGPWQLGKTLGKGATGRVRLAKHAVTGQTAAIKIVSKKSAELVQSASMKRLDQDKILPTSINGTRTMPFGIEREIVVMKLIEHPNIISLYDIWENRGELYLVLEYVEGGELFEYVARNRYLPECEAVRLLRQLIAGLSYCHRFNICHRDLKPENLLLDQDRNLKIADFGMAALQLDGKCLTTSCGSPHYAAPEIVTGEGYSGSAVDIWSVGIILYAMLNGRLPFDGQDLYDTLRLVRKGDYYMPPELSVEATDLIQRLLQRQPRNRISMAEIWEHPLLRKYERLHASMNSTGQLVGPPPPLTSADCGPRPLRAADVDYDLLRNLQILLHGAPEDEVIAKLVNDQPNYEKLFYRALVRFRDEQLENYPGESLQYSTSDYHHITRSRKLPRSSSKHAIHARRSSQFSVISNESTRRSSYYKNPTTAASKTTQGSYDPYRASRKPIAGAGQPETTVRIRAGSTVQHPQVAQLRREASSIPAMPSMESEEVRIILDNRDRLVNSATPSQSSIASSRHRVFKKSSSYRRNIVFNHQRKKSSAAASYLQYDESMPDSDDVRPVTSYSYATVSDSKSTPSLPTPGRVRVRKPRRPASDINLQSSRASRNQYDARKVSAELSKICEEAFNRSSMSVHSELSQALPTDSPATTVSVPEYLKHTAVARRPAFSPALQELIERRSRIIETWGSADPKVLSDIVETLDRRILEEQNREVAAERRSATDPTHNASMRGGSSNAMDQLGQNCVRGSRVVSEPIRAYDNTIRLVTPDPSSPISRDRGRLSKNMPLNSLKGGSPQNPRPSKAHGSHESRNVQGQALEPILEDPSRSPTHSKFNGETKKWAWLNKKSHASHEENPPTPPQKDTPKDKPRHDFLSSGVPVELPRLVQTQSPLVGDVPRRKGWLQKVFGKEKRIPVYRQHEFVNDDGDDQSIDSYDLPTPLPGRASRRGYRPSTNQEPRLVGAAEPTQVSQSWFAKFLHLRPATSVLVMQTSKVRARKEIVKVLKEWRKFGLKDIEVVKRSDGDSIRARVDAINCECRLMIGMCFC